MKLNDMKLKKISLRSLNDTILEEREQSHILGGLECGCGCDGPSSTSSNMSANYAHGYEPAKVCKGIYYDGEEIGALVRPHA